VRQKLREELGAQAGVQPAPRGTTEAGKKEPSGEAEAGSGGLAEPVSPQVPPEAATPPQPAAPQKPAPESSPPAAPEPPAPDASGASAMPSADPRSEPQGAVRPPAPGGNGPGPAASAPIDKPAEEGAAEKPTVPSNSSQSAQADRAPQLPPQAENAPLSALPLESAEPSGPPPPSPEVPAPAEGEEATLEARVAELLPARLQQEVEAVLAQIPDDQLSEKLWELTGEEMEDRLRVAYILATDPATTHYGYIEEIHEMAEVRGEEGNTVLIKVALNKEDLSPEHIRPGASVTAKVECGRRAVGYVWFHDLIAFVRKMWFRWFY